MFESELLVCEASRASEAQQVRTQSTRQPLFQDKKLERVQILRQKGYFFTFARLTQQQLHESGRSRVGTKIHHMGDDARECG